MHGLPQKIRLKIYIFIKGHITRHKELFCWRVVTFVSLLGKKQPINMPLNSLRIAFPLVNKMNMYKGYFVKDSIYKMICYPKVQEKFGD